MDYNKNYQLIWTISRQHRDYERTAALTKQKSLDKSRRLMMNNTVEEHSMEKVADLLLHVEDKDMKGLRH